MRILKSIFRVTEWFGSKLPLSIAVFILFSLLNGRSAASALPLFCFFLLYTVTYLALGYLANDLSDVEQDKIAGKRNAFNSTGIGVGVAAFVVVTIIHFLSAAFIKFTPEFMIFALVAYLFGIFYSFKPLRFKERGVLGLITASFCQRNVQLLVIPFIFEVDLLLFALINVFVFVYGIRYILIHQYMDYENDIVSETKTFVRSAKSVTRGLIYCCAAVEGVLSLFAFSAIFLKVNPTISLVLFIGYLFEILFWGMMKLNKQKDIFTSYFYVPFDFIYLLLIPVLCCITLVPSESENLLSFSVYVISLLYAFYITLKFHIEYIIHLIGAVIFKINCKKIAKRAFREKGIRYINITPENQLPEGEKGSAFVIVSPIKIKLDVKWLLPYFDEEECVEVRYPVSSDTQERISSLCDYFQTKNRSMRGFFSVYIFNKADFGRYHKSTVSKTLISALAHCSEVKTVTDSKLSVEIEDKSALKKEYTRFSALSVTELYHRRSDCFMKLLPVQSLMTFLFLILAAVGYFLEPKLFVFAASFIILNLIFSAVIRLVRSGSSGVELGSRLSYKLTMRTASLGIKRVPRNMVYGIYSDKIVARANTNRIVFEAALISLVISFGIAIAFALLGGVK